LSGCHLWGSFITTTTYEGSRDAGFNLSAPTSSYNPYAQSEGATSNELAYMDYNNLGAIAAAYGIGTNRVAGNDLALAGTDNATNTLFGVSTVLLSMIRMPCPRYVEIECEWQNHTGNPNTDSYTIWCIVMNHRI
jgi:hypothetical protein